MYINTELKRQENNPRLETIAEMVQSVAKKYQEDTLKLLALLRLLESLHREIRDSLFLESLPRDRQTLYTLLKNIEEEGGWPYIHRLKLQSLLKNLAENTFSELELEKNTQSLVECETSKSLSLKQGEIS
ncbi:hypothetical protein [Fischerella thermalis]|uniref:Uncharacterized protein n=1 Tax=Fischerella thermalis CCMEE 5318 TaxID=2019666 RepID=A0A2N6LNF3_9CYAN|nr:hypothetical protein [Fischerella thermalis]MBF1991411.1 hypothetical protein [Fischerella thermalis M58_A2018_009]MBF2061044.1 hypothetical protein [Fischerella thermalis M66_A2018_004]MBF2069120.1 hypothetical protein [Fischerella thermalis M48_A2018_028]PLZ89413.1 hypothetical protein CI593_11705 [Fischerella thermalis CCMEE 5194]PMB27064.1 hypothetical protein CEN46_02260 [Fischerella thermalis CCMEE 5318]